MIEIKQTVTQVSPVLFQSSEGYTFHPSTPESEFKCERTGRIFRCLADEIRNPNFDNGKAESEFASGKSIVLELYLLWPRVPAWADGTPLSDYEIALFKDLAVQTGRLEGSPISNSILP